LGYDSVFVADHLFLGSKGEIWECISTMSALAAITERVEIIPIHLCNNFRHPGVVAKTIATMSHISAGRVTLFYDYGWRKAEFDTYGIDFCSTDGDRIEQMAEGIQIIKGMLEQERFSFDGKYYRIQDAICEPKPVKKIPLWMGEANNPKMIEYIVKYADGFNSMPCSLEAFEEKLEKIRRECDRQERDFESLTLSLETQVLICENEKEVEKTLDEYEQYREFNDSFDQDILKQLEATNPDGTDYSDRDNMRNEFMIGTVETVRQQVEAFKQRGVSHFMLWFMDFPQTKSMERFAQNILQ
jgi:alkanesulfonate monooxygenase SsuD/methylene tetrahydromethanopterin reductase-like flavin-dependent oxidoreductase (luciferase family)